MKIYTKPELAIENLFAAETVADTYGGDVVLDPFEEDVNIGDEVEVKGSKNDDWWDLLGGQD